MLKSYLDFEQPIADLDQQVLDLQDSDLVDDLLQKEVLRLNEAVMKTTEKIYSNLSPWQNVQVARHPERPHFLDYIDRISDHFDELHGDRHFSDDRAVIGGIGSIGEYKVIFIGHEKGRTTDEKILHNFGMSQPEGYRKACRLMELAERFNLPIITLVDTPGAYPGLGAEERGQSEAIARNLLEMSKISTPIISVIIGEGGSGGALAIGVSDKLLMLEYSIYSVISPEGCASILWKDSNMAEKAAGTMHITAEKLKNFSLIDEVIGEPVGGAHRDFEGMAEKMKLRLLKNLNNLNEFDKKSLVSMRQKKIAAYGEYTQV